MAKKLLKCYANGYENVPVYSGYGQTMENSACVDKPTVKFVLDKSAFSYVDLDMKTAYANGEYVISTKNCSTKVLV